MRKSNLFALLSALLLLAFAAPSYAAEPKPASDWKVIPCTNEEGGIGLEDEISVYEGNGAIVYKERSTQSARVTTLPNGTFVTVTELHGRRVTMPDGTLDGEEWVKVTKPVAGFVRNQDLFSSNSDGFWYNFKLFYDGKPLDNFTSDVIDMMWKFAWLDNTKSTMTDMSGKVIPKSSLVEDLDFLEYYQGSDTGAAVFYVLRESIVTDNFIVFATRDRNLTFPGGIRAGGPASAIPKSGLISGEYSESVRNGVKSHTWTGNWIFSVREDGSGNIAEIMLINPVTASKVKLDPAYTAYLGDTPAAPAAAAKPTGEAQPVPAAQPAPAAQGPAAFGNDANNTANTSTDAKVINFFPLTSTQRNTLGIQHRGAYKLYAGKSYQKAYDAFSMLAGEYDCNYLSAYWAGECAVRLKKKDDARAWFDRALAVNPNYKPAADAIARLK